jgi:hypothetical protein
MPLSCVQCIALQCIKHICIGMPIREQRVRAETLDGTLQLQRMLCTYQWLTSVVSVGKECSGSRLTHLLTKSCGKKRDTLTVYHDDISAPLSRCYGLIAYTPAKMSSQTSTSFGTRLPKRSPKWRRSAVTSSWKGLPLCVEGHVWG